MPESFFSQWPVESDLNTDSIDIWFAILWKDMEVPFEVKLEEKPCGICLFMLFLLLPIYIAKILYNICT